MVFYLRIEGFDRDLGAPIMQTWSIRVGKKIAVRIVGKG
jgi:hypothetical protein